MGDDHVTASDWAKGIGYSIIASLIGGASKLAIRKSWLMVQERHRTISQDEYHESTVTTNNSGTIVTVDPAIKEGNVSQLSPSSYKNPSTLVRRSPSNLNVTMDNHSSLNNNPAPSFSPEEEDIVPSISTKTHRIALALRGSGMFGMTFLNPLFCVLAMNYASPSILAPFSGLTLVWIVLFSEAMIQEPPQRIQIIAATLIIAGQVIVAVFGDHTNDENVSLDDLEKSYQNIYFQLYFVFMTLWMISLATIIITKGPTPTLCRFAWGVSGGSITGFQNFLKDTLTIIKAVDSYNEQGQNGGGDDDGSDFEPISYPWYTPLMMLGAMSSAFGGLLLLTACMKRYDATFSSAMFVGSFVISASIMSAVHYQTFQHLNSIWNWILYPAGLCILMVGVWILVNETMEVYSLHDDDVQLGVSGGRSRVGVKENKDVDQFGEEGEYLSGGADSMRRPLVSSEFEDMNIDKTNSDGSTDPRSSPTLC